MKLKRWQIVLLVIFVALVVVRMALPGIILPRINEKLATASETVLVHIGDLDLSIIRGAYRLEGISIRSKVDPDTREFVHVDSLDISIAWRELFRGRVLADAALDRLTVVVGVNISQLNKSTTADEKKTDAKEIVHKIIPIDVSRVTVVNSRLIYFNKENKSELELLNNVQGRISNISNSKHEKIEIPSLVTLKGDLFGDAAVTASGTMLPFRSPLPMAFRVKVTGFKLEKANPFLLDIVPFSFTAGQLNALAEFKLEQNNLEGYVKPFFHDVKVLSSKEKIRGPKHFFMEIGAALANAILKNGNTQTTAAVVPFSRPENGHFSAEIGTLLTSAVKNGYVEPMPEEFENTIHLKNFEQYQ